MRGRKRTATIEMRRNMFDMLDSENFVILVQLILSVWNFSVVKVER